MVMQNTVEIPKQRLFDYLTRIDELVIENTKAIRSLEAAVNIILGIQQLSLPELKQRLESGQWVPYRVIKLDMTAARTDEPIVVEGDRLNVQTDGTLDGVTIRFNMQNSDPVPVKYFNPWRQQFFQLFLTHTAQAGKTLYLAVGRLASAEPSSFEFGAELLNNVSAPVDSTVAVLGIAATYTGTAFSCVENGRIVGSCFADQAGTLYIDQRLDGINWDIRSTIAYVANDPMGFSVEVVAPEARVVFLNGAVGQGTFRLYTSLRRV